MFFDTDNSKEAIKTRMLRIALSYWEMKNADELDPLVKLLMEALSAELYDVVNDIKNAEGRILEKMAHLLAPDLLTAPAPAHAIMQAIPAEPSELITDEDVFYVEKKIASKPDGPLDTNVDIYFTPVNSLTIFETQIKTVFSGANLYGFDEGNNKMLLGNPVKATPTNERSIWLGMNCSSRVSSINGLTFFFDLKNVDSSLADYFYQFLPSAKWYINDKEINVFTGLQSVRVDNKTGMNTAVANTDVMQSIKNNINEYYNAKFITIIDKTFELKPELQVQCPDKLKTAFSPTLLQKMADHLLWIKITFPTTVQQELLDELSVKVNAFPVANCKPNELRFRLRSGRNIIPLPTVLNERFLSIKSFTDGETQYKAIPFRKAGEEEVGTYTLRTGGLERFDSRNGREMIQYLLELLRSESAAFSAYGHDFIASTLKEMNQFIALLEQKTNTTISDAFEIPNYIIVKPSENQEMMFVEYWTTNMDIANNIRSGIKVQQSSGVAIRSESLVLLTSTTGGKDKLRSEEKLYAFKYGLLTRDRIVTAEDIRSFCFYELGTRLRNVTVKRGFEISNNPREAAKRTIDVILDPANQKTVNIEEWEKLRGQLKSKLQTRSGMSNNYRILLNDVA